MSKDQETETGSPPTGGSATPPKRIFEILVKAYKFVIVEAGDEEAALQLAAEECSSFNWEVDAWDIERELHSPDDIKNAKRYGAQTLENWSG